MIISMQSVTIAVVGILLSFGKSSGFLPTLRNTPWPSNSRSVPGDKQDSSECSTRSKGAKTTTSTLFYQDNGDDTAHGEHTRAARKHELLELLKDIPSNRPTSRRLTRTILSKCDELTAFCPTSESDLLESLGGSWELLWTAQDRRSREWRMNPLRAWINPLENQSYSNNPDGSGRSNPLLPRGVQDRLERMGVIRSSHRDDPQARSTQTVDLKNRRVQNVVVFDVPSIRERWKNPRRASLTVNIRFRPSRDGDLRKVAVRFTSCRLRVGGTPLSLNLPLGPAGPRGWLRTDYIDDTIRITRGHKGSVFILRRTTPKNIASKEEEELSIQEDDSATEEGEEETVTEGKESAIEEVQSPS